MNEWFRKIVFVSDLDEAALLRVRRPFVALVITRIFEGESGGKDLAGILINEYCADAEFVASRRRFLCL